MGKKSPSIPSKDDLVSYSHAVAGHAGTMSDEAGELFIKPCTQAEIDFYECANQQHLDFATLLPDYYGTLMLSDSADLSSIEEGVVGPIAAAAEKTEIDNVTWVENKTRKIKTDLAVVLENTSSGFKQPNIMDCKLGLRLWADDAPLQKKQRFDKIAQETTHRNHGFRIAGMKVYRGSEDRSDLDEDGFRVYDKDFGRLQVNDHNLVQAMRSFVYNEAAGIDDELARAVCEGFARDIRRVQEVLENNETRMYSASLLFAFEGDGDALRAAIDENNRYHDDLKAGKVSRVVDRVDSGIGMLEDDEDDEHKLPKIYTLKLIDMAHADWVPGQGPDENSLMGVRSLAKIFEELAQ